MLYIEEGEKTILPKKYKNINNITVIIYDQLTEILKDKFYNSLTSTKIATNLQNQKLVEELNKDEIHIIDWLQKNKLDEELKVFLTKHVTLLVLSDFLNFIYESISCAKKGKMSVAFALVRKPLTDELLIFEQILNDNNDFIERFYYDGSPIEYDPSNRNVNKEEIIEKALNNICPKFILDKDLIYDLRYNKSFSRGLNAISNHALHIVTNDKNYKTENQNLNFVFSVPEEQEKYWDHFYFTIPYLLIYTASILDEIVFKFLPENEEIYNYKSYKVFRRLLGQIFYGYQTGSIDNKNINKILRQFSKVLILKCSICSKEIKLTKADFQLFFNQGFFLCSNCLNPLKDDDINYQIRSFIESLNQRNKQ